MKEYSLILIVFLLSLFSANSSWSDDHGNSCDNATPIILNSSGRAIIEAIHEYADDVDYFKIDLPSRGGLWVKHSDDMTIEERSELKNSNCETIQSYAGAEWLILAHVNAGTYYLAINYARNPITVFFLEDDHGDSFETATEIILDSAGNGQAYGTSASYYDWDYFKVNLSSAGSLSASVPDYLDIADLHYYLPYLKLFNSDYTLIMEQEVQVLSVPVVAGDYYIAVIAEPLFQFNYTLAVNFEWEEGELKVNIDPPEAIAAGAQWRVDSGAWQNSGVTQSGLSVGNHTVQFKPIAGWTTPTSQTVSITAGQTTTTAGTYIQLAGALKVTIDPPEAVAAGAQWRVDGGTWQNSDTIESSLPVGNHTIEFKAIPGWTTPASQTVAITNAATTSLKGTYVRQLGALTVTLSPSEALAAGAQWRIDGGGWLDSGTTQNGLFIGSHTIEFKPISGWTTPGNQSVSIANGQTTTVSATYIQLTGSLTVTISPSAAVSEGARWKVDAGEWQISGATITNLSVGNHLVEFKPITGWTTPNAKTVTINNGQTATSSGSYIQQVGSLKVTLSPSASVSSGAQWRLVGDDTWRNSGNIQSGIAVGNYTIEFKEISGWAKPGNQNVTITNGQTTSANATYSKQIGSLTVIIDPSAAVSAGAQWRVDGEDWQDSGAIFADLSVGSHLVEFKVVPDWIEPQTETVTIAENQTTTLTIDYIPEESTPPQVIEVLPIDGAGIYNNIRVPNNTSFAVRLSDESGIDIEQAESVVFEIAYYDTLNFKNHEYSRDLSNNEVRIVKLFNADSDDSVTELWAVYDKASDVASGDKNYPFDTEVGITVIAKDKFDNILTSSVYQFRTETEEENEHANDSANLPATKTSTGSNQTTITAQSVNLEGVQLIYANDEPIEPYFGPEFDEVPELDVANGIGWPLNLQPSTVFNRPVTIRIPCPYHNDVSDLSIYRYDGAQWKLACDGDGQVQAGGEAWIVPGSRKNYNYYEDPENNDPSMIEIQVYHFSGLQVGSAIPQTGSLTVTITPQDAADDGAKWRVDGGDWQDSGHTESNLSLGSHNVEFKAVSGWITPQGLTVTVQEGQTATATGTYEEEEGQIPEGNSNNSGGEGGGGGGCFIGSLTH